MKTLLSLVLYVPLTQLDKKVFPILKKIKARLSQYAIYATMQEG